MKVKPFNVPVQQYFQQLQAAEKFAASRPKVGDIITVEDKQYLCKEWFYGECILEEIKDEQCSSNL